MNISKLGSFKIPSATITSLSEVTNERYYFYELWKQYKQLKTMKMNVAQPNTYNEEYVISNLGSFLKFSCSSRSTDLKDIISRNIFEIISKTAQISIGIFKSCSMKRSLPL